MSSTKYTKIIIIIIIKQNKKDVLPTCNESCLFLKSLLSLWTRRHDLILAVDVILCIAVQWIEMRYNAIVVITSNNQLLCNAGLVAAIFPHSLRTKVAFSFWP